MNSKKEITKKEEELLLLKAIQADEDGAFDKLILRYQDMVFNICYQIMRDYDEARDCAQDTFIKIFKSIKKFRGESQFSTWIYRIAVNTCKNSLSSLSGRIKKKSLSIDNPFKNEEEKTLELKDSSASPEELFLQQEDEKLVLNSIHSLPTNKRILIILRDLEGKSYDEIAEITGLKLGTIKSKLARSRELLKARLKEALQS